MKYHHPFPLKCRKLIAAYVEQAMSQYASDRIYMIKVALPDRIRHMLDTELSGLGLSTSIGTVAFKRNTATQFDKTQYTHVDYDEHTNTVTDAGIIIPVSGCDGTGMYWVDGNYTLTKSHDHAGNSRMDVAWNTPGKIVHQVQITEPTLVRVNIPHGAYSRQDGSYRLILSVRLKNNETFDSIVDKLVL
jgi:hypothetical protein